jgi:hypothetical protein
MLQGSGAEPCKCSGGCASDLLGSGGSGGDWQGSARNECREPQLPPQPGPIIKHGASGAIGPIVA